MEHAEHSVDDDLAIGTTWSEGEGYPIEYAFASDGKGYSSI